MRVLHVVARSHHRGAEVFAVELAAELDRLGHENEVVALQPGLDGRETLGLPVLAPGPSALAVARSALALRRRLRRAPVDVVLAHGGRTAVAVALGASPRRHVLVWQRILPFPPHLWFPGRRHLWRGVVARFDACIALTADLGAELRRLDYRGAIWTIPNARNPRRFRDLDRDEAARTLRADLRLPADEPLVGFVGHLVRQKRPDRAIEAVLALRARGRRAHLVLAGDGPLRSDLEAQVEAAGAGDAVSFLGHRPDVEQVLGAVDLLLMTSDSEGVPGVLIEAGMAGCPVLTVPVGQVATVVEHGITGWVLDGADTGTLVDGLVAALDDPEGLRAMGEAAVAHSRAHTTESVARRYEQRLTEVLAARSGGPVAGLAAAVPEAPGRRPEPDAGAGGR